MSSSSYLVRKPTLAPQLEETPETPPSSRLKCSFFCFLPTSQIVPSIFFHLFHFHLHLTAKFLTSAFGFHSMLFHFLLWVLPATQRHHVCFLFFFPSSVSYFSQKYSLLDTVFWKSSSTLLFPNLSQYIYPYTEPDF